MARFIAVIVGDVDYLAAVILALVQGLTEFLPISSSAHLILVPRFLGWEDQGLAFDVAVHLGTLTAVVAYFRREIASILRAWFSSLLGQAYDPVDARLGWAILVASLPVLLAGFFLEGVVDTSLRSPLLIAGATALFGALLWLADQRRGRLSDERKMRVSKAVFIGLAQVLALIPGTSRSGITITAGLWLGLSRQTAARFSFLLAIPVIAGASVLEFWELVQRSGPVPWGVLFLGLALAALTAYLCIGFFLRTVERIGMLPFVVYRLFLAGVIFYAFR